MSGLLIIKERPPPSLIIVFRSRHQPPNKLKSAVVRFNTMQRTLYMTPFGIALLVFVAASSCNAQCQQDSDYDPTMYKGNRVIPLNCTPGTPPDCPRSWKSGVDDGKSTDLPLIDTLFVICHEGFSTCGYVPLNSETGEVAGMSGVTIGAGVDLGSKDRNYFTSIGVTDNTLLDQLEPYFGLTRNAAACAILNRPLVVTSMEANLLTEKVKNDIATRVEQRYDQNRQPGTMRFRDLPRGIRTAIADVWFQFGLPPAYPSFWGFVTKNDWKGAVKELRNFYTNPQRQLRGDLKRRNDEADIIEAALATCNRSIDGVFLIDESGSIDSSDFESAKTFVSSIIGAFPDDKIGKNGSQFGLSVFDSTYRPVFYLSTYSTKAQYLTAINRVTQNQGGTRLGAALTQILSDQFTEARGLRSETEGLPRILIVLTDGRSDDSVATPAANIHNNNIVIYAIGIGGYNQNQLNQVASSPSHVKLLDTFSDLNNFAATLTASTCNEPQPVSLETKISGNVEQDSFQYYKFEIPNRRSNLRVELNDLDGKTLMYASRDNPHPYQYDNTFGFTSSSSSRKTIVIGPESNSPEKRQISNAQFIYISVTADTETATYTLEGTTCNITECSEGISRAHLPHVPIFTFFVTIMVIFTILF